MTYNDILKLNQYVYHEFMVMTQKIYQS